MVLINGRGKSILIWGPIWMALTFLLLIGCAATPSSVEINNSLPPEKLAIYNDSFETIRSDMWDRAGMVFEEKQLQGFKLADMRIENGQLVIETKTGAFSKGGLDTKYALGGDFDIQLECHIDFLKGIHNMDQRAVFMVYDKSKTFKKTYYVIFEIAKRGGESDGSIFSGYGKSGKFYPGKWHQLNGFHSLLRIVRQGNRISTFYKKENRQNWVKLNTFSSTTANLTAGFMLVNFYSSRGASITAKSSVKATFDNFKINAVQLIVEEDI